MGCAAYTTRVSIWLCIFEKVRVVWKESKEGAKVAGKCYDPRVFSKAWELHLRSSVIAGGVAREPWILITKGRVMAALRIA